MEVAERSEEDTGPVAEIAAPSRPDNRTVFGWALVSALAALLVFVSAIVFCSLLSTLLVVVLTVYFMADLPRLRRGIVRLFPRRHRPHVQHATTVVIEKVGAYMIGNLIISVIAGATSFVMLLILRVPFALPL